MSKSKEQNKNDEIFEIQYSSFPIIIRSIPKDIFQKINFLKLFQGLIFKKIYLSNYFSNLKCLNFCFSTHLDSQLNNIVSYFEKGETFDINLVPLNHLSTLYNKFQTLFIDGSFVQVAGNIAYVSNPILFNISSKLKSFYQKDYKNFYNLFLQKYSIITPYYPSIVYETLDKELFVINTKNEKIKTFSKEVFGWAFAAITSNINKNEITHSKKIHYIKTYFNVYDFCGNKFLESLSGLFIQYNLSTQDLKNIFIVCQDLTFILHILNIIFGKKIENYIENILRIDDLFLGWNPWVTFFEFVLNAQTPALYVDFSHIPVVYVMMSI